MNNSEQTKLIRDCTDLEIVGLIMLGLQTNSLVAFVNLEEACTEVLVRRLHREETDRRLNRDVSEASL